MFEQHKKSRLRRAKSYLMLPRATPPDRRKIFPNIHVFGGARFVLFSGNIRVNLMEFIRRNIDELYNSLRRMHDHNNR